MVRMAVMTIVYLGTIVKCPFNVNSLTPSFLTSLDNINQLPNAANYESFAYHVDLLAQFQRETVILGNLERRHSFGGEKQTNSVHGSDVYKNMKRHTSSMSEGRGSDNLNNSWHLGQTGAS